MLLAVGFLFHPALSSHLPASPPDPPDSAFQVGEELTYNVSYGSFDIGRVRISLLERIVSDHGGAAYRSAASIDSYRGIPFVNLHSVYTSVIDQDIHSNWFNARAKEDDRWKEWTYQFDYPRSSLYIDEGIWKEKTIVHRDTLRVDTFSQDGLSLFFLARAYLLSHQRMTIPTIVREKKGKTVIAFTGERSKKEIDAVAYPIDVIHFDGEAKFVGIFGLTGGFEGWFSNDQARVPILAYMNVLIGKIRIELTSWKRSGWTPPRYVGNAGE
jgi:hypothetical protein